MSMGDIPTLNVVSVLVAQKRLAQLLEWELDDPSPAALDPYWRKFDEAFHALWLEACDLHDVRTCATDIQLP
jgi:hypothetical protein